MTAVLLILKSFGGFIAEHWKAALVVAGALIIAGTLYFQQVKIENLHDEIAKKDAVIAFQLETIAAHEAVNLQWVAASEEWEEAVATLQGMADSYATQLEAEIAAKMAALQAQAEVEAELAAQVTADDCEGALDQLIDALGWGAP